MENSKKINYPLSFKAAFLDNVNSPLRIEEVRFDGPLDFGQVLVKINYSGICGKQIEEIQGLSNFNGKPDPFIPHMLGHEGIARVLDTGPGVNKVKAEDYVVLHWLKGSGINAATPIYKQNKQKINAGWITTFNQYGVISENRMTPIEKPNKLEIGCLLGCCVTTGLGVVLNEARPLPEDSVTVFGCGGVGLNSIQGAKLCNANPIIAVDNNYNNLKLAEKFGATHAINADHTDVLKEIEEITKGQYSKYVITALSNLNAMETSIEACSMPGEVYLVGVPPLNSSIKINPFAVHASRKLQGSPGGGCFPDRDIPKYLNLYNQGKIKLDELISNEVSLNEINKGISMVKSGELNGRCVVKMP